MAEPALQAPPPFAAANVRGLVFDLDGTLTDDDKRGFERHSLSSPHRRGVPEPRWR